MSKYSLPLPYGHDYKAHKFINVHGFDNTRVIPLPDYDYILESGDNLYSSLTPAEAPRKVKLGQRDAYEHRDFIISDAGLGRDGKYLESFDHDHGAMAAFVNHLGTRQDTDYMRRIAADVMHEMRYGWDQYSNYYYHQSGDAEWKSPYIDTEHGAKNDLLFQRPADHPAEMNSVYAKALVDRLNEVGMGSMQYIDDPYVYDMMFRKLAKNPFAKFNRHDNVQQMHYQFEFLDEEGENITGIEHSFAYQTPRTMERVMREHGPRGIIMAHTSKDLEGRGWPLNYTAMNAFKDGKQIVSHPNNLIADSYPYHTFESKYNLYRNESMGQKDAYGETHLNYTGYNVRQDSNTASDDPFQTIDRPTRVLGVIRGL